MDALKAPPSATPEWLTPPECAEWLRITPRQLAEKSRGRRPLIPCVKIGHRTIRYHTTTVIEALKTKKI